MDDFLSVTTSRAENEQFKAEICTVWKISDLGTPHFVVSIAICWDREAKAVHLSQTALIDRLIATFGQKDTTPVSILMDPGLHMQHTLCSSLSQAEQHDLSKLPYRLLVGDLLYLAIGTRLDISYAV